MAGIHERTRRRLVVAIDGPSGVGKTTVARGVAAALGIPHLDTGAYYRLATLLTLEAGRDPAAADDVLLSLAHAEVDFADGLLVVNGTPIGGRLRSGDVTDAVSIVAAHPSVRERVVQMQREWVADHGGSAVVEGRDIGTAVFPDAPVKVFLTADVATRAMRRSRDPESGGADLGDLAAKMSLRDHLDSSRETSPLRPAGDAVIVDTTHLAASQVVATILDLVGAV